MLLKIVFQQWAMKEAWHRMIVFLTESISFYTAKNFVNAASVKTEYFFRGIEEDDGRFQKKSLGDLP